MHDNMNGDRPASIEVLDVHLGYVRDDIQKILREMQNMATTDDIRRLSERMDKFVTTDRFDALERRVEDGQLSTSFSKVTRAIQSFAATVAALIALGGVLFAVVHFIDKMKG